MKIAIVGATGNVGRRLVDEAMRRKHDVTAVARNVEPIIRRAELRALSGDVDNAADLGKALVGQDVIISAVPFRSGSPQQLLTIVRASAVSRYLVVGGAGSLWSAPGLLHLDSPMFPPAAREEASKGKAFLDVLREVDDLDWTMLSPAALITDGERTGHFRLGDDELLRGPDGKSWISYQDYALALLDEAELPRHRRRRFTVGY